MAFGYLSLLRLLFNRQTTGEANFISGLLNALKDPKMVRNLGSSAFFVSLPATALLLFWGWGPALIWLATFHFLIESIYQLQYSIQKEGASIADHLLRSSSGIKAMLEQGLIQVFFLLAMAVVVALVATLLDRQPGLLFALVFLLPARKLLSHSSNAIPIYLKALGAIGLLATGLAFSDQLGFSVYGDWAPFGQMLPWFVFNMPTLIAAILVVAVFKLEGDRGFKQDLSLFAGAIIMILVVAMLVKLAWLQPILDAPLNSGSSGHESLPVFIGLSLFVFAGFAAFLVRILNEEENDEQHSKYRYGRLQGASLVHTIYMALLVVSLASALGIGAWKTHFVEWSSALDILNYLNLAISSNLNLIYADASSGTLLHTILLAALCFTGFSFLLMCANQLTVEEADTETVFSLVIEAKILQAIGIFIVSAYFIGNGISINVWLLIGILAWVLFSHLAIGMCLASDVNPAYSVLTILIAVAGILQTIAVTITWLAEGNYLLPIFSFIILAMTIFLWMPDAMKLFKAAGKDEKPDFL